MFKVFLDDERMPPIDGSVWIIVRNYIDFMWTFIELQGKIKFVSFDHDLGHELTGYDCAKGLVELCMNDGFDIPNFYVHSQNPVGAENIRAYLNNARNHLNSKG